MIIQGGTSRSWLIGYAILVLGLSVALYPQSLRGQDDGQGKGKEKKDGEKATKKKDSGKKEPEDSDAKDKDKEDGDGEVKKRDLSVDESYVQDNLKELLKADKLEFDENGRVTIEFDFSKKKEEHMEVFEPPLSNNLQSNFRYTSGREEHVDYFEMEGIKIANQGRTVLKCWFLDDVTAEVEYIARGSFTPGQVFAICFSDAQNKKALGSNFGTQCVTLNGGSPAGKSQGTAEALNVATRTKMKLVVHGGSFEAYRSDRKKANMDYKPKDFSTGQIGFAWSGKIAGSVTYLKINGRIDAKKTSEMLRKGGRK